MDEIFDRKTARPSACEPERVVILIHSGSRGLGHQVCTDYVQRMDRAAERYGITLPDRQLACAPLSSPEGKSYFAAMAAAANFAFCNRQVITQRIREVWRRAFWAGSAGQLRLLYDVAHNIAKIERYGNAQPVRAPQGRHPRLRTVGERAAAGLPGRGPAGADPRQHGHGLVRAGRHRRGGGADLAAPAATAPAGP